VTKPSRPSAKDCCDILDPDGIIVRLYTHERHV